MGARVVDVTTLLASLSVAPGDRVGARVVDVTTLLASLSVARGIGWGLGSWM